MREIKSSQLDKYPITYTATILQISCKNHTIKKWRNFSDEEIDKMAYGMLDWWKKNKDFIFDTIERYPAC